MAVSCHRLAASLTRWPDGHHAFRAGICHESDGLRHFSSCLTVKELDFSSSAGTRLVIEFHLRDHVSSKSHCMVAEMPSRGIETPHVNLPHQHLSGLRIPDESRRNVNNNQVRNFKLRNTWKFIIYLHKISRALFISRWTCLEEGYLVIYFYFWFGLNRVLLFEQLLKLISYIWLAEQLYVVDFRPVPVESGLIQTKPD